MFRLLWRLIRLTVACLVLGVGFYFGGPYLLAGLGHYLVTERAPAKADLLVVLAGEPFLRVPEAARLYHRGLAPTILLAREVFPPGFEEVRQLGMAFPDSLEISLRILAGLHVPRSAILTLAEPADSTWAEAEAVGRFLAGRPVQSLILVTSRSHTTRAQKIFASGLGSGFQVGVHPVGPDPFNPARWWRQRADVKQVIHEYLGLADYYRRRLWEWIGGQLGGAPPPVRIARLSGEGP